MSTSKVNRYIVFAAVMISTLLCTISTAQSTESLFTKSITVFSLSELSNNPAFRPFTALDQRLEKSLPYQRSVVLKGNPGWIIGTKEFGWFCKAEWELEKRTNLPLRFRLGSLQEANRLEGK